MLKHIHPITKEAAIEVASNLRLDDYIELTEGHGKSPEELPLLALQSDSYYYKTPDGKIAAMGGFDNDRRIWMLCTPIIEERPYTFAKVCVNLLNSISEELLCNIVDKRHKTHLKLLKFLGFKFLREIKHGPHNLPFTEFCRIKSNF